MNANESKLKNILDVCCGFKQFYADKNNPNVLFCDLRAEVNPNLILDFTNKLPFEDESFYLVIFDPPHIAPNRGSEKSIMVQNMGSLAKGFNECMRVLKPNGTLIFKWSEAHISLKSILECFDKEPLLMQKSSRTSHFCVFYKESVKIDTENQIDVEVVGNIHEIRGQENVS
ncbi:SAM-dependent methyltransferase [Helicobacter sp. MIT 11-5569]|uniref:class I SAM-dependent methyltransferase n=1 Tax=Helicobacter sp. MIT 11-5569 TaxID=1548151 RepID=UPI00068DCF0C|nr:class I SAM-dependent methyltransferase [Helicobacter sp. MIT 11-5569]TLD83932.1 SAM-dependent methyltransferase [Helicobacter sp. MIT 11-5569]